MAVLVRSTSPTDTYEYHSFLTDHFGPLVPSEVLGSKIGLTPTFYLINTIFALLFVAAQEKENGRAGLDFVTVMSVGSLIMVKGD